ncbi:Uncharacterized protein HZ326_30332, partial [Fusarium oxysporum f. sp. albedinis]
MLRNPYACRWTRLDSEGCIKENKGTRSSEKMEQGFGRSGEICEMYSPAPTFPAFSQNPSPLFRPSGIASLFSEKEYDILTRSISLHSVDETKNKNVFRNIVESLLVLAIKTNLPPGPTPFP